MLDLLASLAYRDIPPNTKLMMVHASMPSPHRACRPCTSLMSTTYNAKVILTKPYNISCTFV